MRPQRIAGMLFAMTAILSAQVGTVQNAAVYQAAGSGGVGFIFGNGPFAIYDILLTSNENIIAPRMLAVLSYSTLEPINGVILTSQPVTATLSIRPVGSGTAMPVTVTNADASAITFVVPAGVPVGGAELLYQIAGQPTQWTTVNVVQSSFEFFRVGTGGPAIAKTLAPNGLVSNAGLATPAQPGQTLLLTGSGLGYGSTTSATIGGVAAPVLYAGPSGTQAGRDDIQIQIPLGIPDGCYLPLNFTYNQTTVTTTISKTSDGSPCKHPWQLSVNDMKTLDSGGSLNDGIVNLSSQLSVVSSSAGSRTESAEMNLSQLNAGGVAAYFSAVAPGPGCTIPTPVGVPNETFALINGSLPIPAVPNIGTSVTLQSQTTSITLTGVTDTGLFSQALAPPTDGPLNNLPAPVIAGGKWTFQSSGGPDLPASSFGFTLPAPIQLGGGAPISINHNQDQTITWNGGAFDAGATANIYLSSGSAATVFCTAPAGTGTLTIPAALLSGFGANTIGTLNINLSESGSFLPHAQFQLQDGSTLLVVVSFSSIDSRPVFFQ